MRNKYRYWMVMALWFANSAVYAELITDKQDVSVKVEDADIYLKPAPAQAQLGLLKKRDALIERLTQLYLAKAIAEQQKKIPMTADEQADFDKLVAQFHVQRKIKQLALQDLPDFEPLAKLHYDANKADYVSPEMVAAEHILISTKKHSDKEAQKIAQDLIAKLKKGANFAELADKYSDDPSAKTNHGKLGFFGKGQMFKDFEEAAFALKLNEISKPIQTDFGWHVIRKYEEKKATPKTFAEVKGELIEKQRKEYLQKRQADFFTSVKKDNDMKVDDKAVDAYIAEKTKQLEAQIKPVATTNVDAQEPSAEAKPAVK